MSQKFPSERRSPPEASLPLGGFSRAHQHMRRRTAQRTLDFAIFPSHAVVPIRAGEPGIWGVSARASERFDYTAREVLGYMLDVGCRWSGTRRAYGYHPGG